MTNDPSSAVCAPWRVPRTMTLANATGSLPPLSVTLPEMVPVPCAWAAADAEHDRDDDHPEEGEPTTPKPGAHSSFLPFCTCLRWPTDRWGIRPDYRRPSCVASTSSPLFHRDRAGPVAPAPGTPDYENRAGLRREKKQASAAWPTPGQLEVSAGVSFRVKQKISTDGGPGGARPTRRAAPRCRGPPPRRTAPDCRPNPVPVPPSSPGSG